MLAEVQTKRATFTRWNTDAETCRQLHRLRFASVTDRLAVTDQVTDSALGLAMLLESPELAHTPAWLCRVDGSSVFQRRGESRYTTTGRFSRRSSGWWRRDVTPPGLARHQSPGT